MATKKQTKKQIVWTAELLVDLLIEEPTREWWVEDYNDGSADYHDGGVHVYERDDAEGYNQVHVDEIPTIPYGAYRLVHGGLELERGIAQIEIDQKEPRMAWRLDRDTEFRTLVRETRYYEIKLEQLLYNYL